MLDPLKKKIFYCKDEPEQLEDQTQLKKLHAVIGIITEIHELFEFSTDGSGIEFKENVLEELGDILFYVQALANEHDLTIEDIIQANMDKLKARYDGVVFNADKANHRDLDREADVLRVHEKSIQEKT